MKKYVLLTCKSRLLKVQTGIALSQVLTNNISISNITKHNFFSKVCGDQAERIFFEFALISSTITYARSLMLVLMLMSMLMLFRFRNNIIYSVYKKLALSKSN